MRTRLRPRGPLRLGRSPKPSRPRIGSDDYPCAVRRLRLAASRSDTDSTVAEAHRQWVRATTQC